MWREYQRIRYQMKYEAIEENQDLLNGVLVQPNSEFNAAA